MKEKLTDEQKSLLLLNDTKCNDIVYAIRREDIQYEAINRFEKLLNDDEIEHITEKLKEGMDTNILFLYDAIFSDVINDE
jgi:hypothetical protein